MPREEIIQDFGVLKDGNLLMGTFVMKSEDLGNFYFVDGASVQISSNDYVWIDVPLFKKSTTLLKPPIPSPNLNSATKPSVIDKMSVCDNHGKKFTALGKEGFKKYVTCHKDNFKYVTCPQGSIFYFVLQCCVPISKFPCESNCLIEGQTKEEPVHDYHYFHY